MPKMSLAFPKSCMSKASFNFDLKLGYVIHVASCYKHAIHIKDEHKQIAIFGLLNIQVEICFTSLLFLREPKQMEFVVPFPWFLFQAIQAFL